MGSSQSTIGDLPQLTGDGGSFGNFDMHTLDITPHVTSGDTSATVMATSDSDVYYLNAVIISITSYERKNLYIFLVLRT